MKKKNNSTLFLFGLGFLASLILAIIIIYILAKCKDVPADDVNIISNPVTTQQTESSVYENKDNEKPTQTINVGDLNMEVVTPIEDFSGYNNDNKLPTAPAPTKNKSTAQVKEDIDTSGTKPAYQNITPDYSKVEKKSKLIIVGDEHVNFMSNDLAAETHLDASYIYSNGANLDWLKTIGMSKVLNSLSEDDVIFIWMGKNDLRGTTSATEVANNYFTYIKEQVSGNLKNNKVVFCSISYQFQDNDSRTVDALISNSYTNKSEVDTSIETFNRTLSKLVDNNNTYFIQLNSYINTSTDVWRDEATGIYFNSEVYTIIYNKMLDEQKMFIDSIH